MAMRPPVGAPTLNRRTRILLIAAGVLVLLLLGGSRLITFYVDWLWFGEVGYRNVFTTIIFTRDPAVPARCGADRRGGRPLAVDRLPVPPGLRPRLGSRRPDRPVPHRDHLAVAALRDRHPAARRRDRGPRGAGRLADRAAVPALHGLRGHRPRVRHRRQLLRLRAALLPLGAGLAVHRRHDQLHRGAGRALHVRRHPADGSRRAGVGRRARPPGRARRGVRAAQGRRVLPRPLRAAVLDAQPDVHRCHLHRPERRDARQADPALHLDHLRGGVLRRGVPAQPAAARDRRRAAGAVERAGRCGVARGAAAVRRRTERERARGPVDPAQHRRHAPGVRPDAGQGRHPALRRHVGGDARRGRGPTATRSRTSACSTRASSATRSRSSSSDGTSTASPTTSTSTATPSTGRRRTTSSPRASSTARAWSTTSRTGSTGTWSTPTATAWWWPRRTR